MEAKLDNLMHRRDQNLAVDVHELLETIEAIYPLITVPKDTLIFHSNSYFYEDIIQLENFGDSMFIQDIKRYINKIFDNTMSLPDSESYSRVYANFTYAGNIEVQANANVSEHIYNTTTDLYFIQIPLHRNVSIKDKFDLRSVKTIKEYIKLKNVNREKPISGFITITEVDKTKHLDVHATRFNISSSEICYPEIVILDGFDKFRKIGQWDLYDLTRGYSREAKRIGGTEAVSLPAYDSSMNKLSYLQALTYFLKDEEPDTDKNGQPKTKTKLNDLDIEKIIPTTTDVLLTYFDLSKETIGKFGSENLIVYKLINFRDNCVRDAFLEEF